VGAADDDDDASVTLLHESPVSGGKEGAAKHTPTRRAAWAWEGPGGGHGADVHMAASPPHGAEASTPKRTKSCAEELQHSQSSLSFTGRDSSLFNASPMPSMRPAHAPQKSSPFSINASSISPQPHAATCPAASGREGQVAPVHVSRVCVCLCLRCERA